MIELIQRVIPMFYIVFAILIGTIGFTLSQAWLIRRLRDHYSRPLPAWPTDKPWPKAAVILSLRGNDPFLESCLRNLIRQDYPNFFVQIVIDSETDPAWGAIRAVQAECGPTRLRVTTLQNRSSKCSLKNSSIIQAINSLPQETEVVAFVDADAITHSTWLRSLVAPLADPETGCTTGIRWFAPTDNTFATRLRCFWNLIAASGIFHSSTPWGRTTPTIGYGPGRRMVAHVLRGRSHSESLATTSSKTRMRSTGHGRQSRIDHGHGMPAICQSADVDPPAVSSSVVVCGRVDRVYRRTPIVPLLFHLQNVRVR